jgi:hypothetical protein
MISTEYYSAVLHNRMHESESEVKADRVAAQQDDDKKRDIKWSTMRVDRKERTVTRRNKKESGSSFKNWIVHCAYENTQEKVVLRTSRMVYDALKVDTWYDLEVKSATVNVTSYWLGEFRENKYVEKIDLLESVGICAETAAIILEYSFPTQARSCARPKRTDVIASTLANLRKSDQLCIKIGSRPSKFGRKRQSPIQTT